ncbi:MAG: glycosyltransferase family 39 protein [Anaerolineae bacterium]|nr:glycosyltransferase family 39 protein [Anaerolineae bacterium]
MKRRWVLATVLVLVWLFAVVAFYYVAHKPFTATHLCAIGQALAGLGGALLVVALGTGIGVRLLRGLTVARADRLILAAAVGLGVLSLVGLALGTVGLLRPWVLWLLTVAGLLLTSGPLWRALAAAWADFAWRPQGRFEGFLAVYCGILLALALLRALAPPTAWDGLVYHLTGPKLYLETGHVSHPLDLPYLGFPQLMGMLFTWGMGLAGERAAAPIHWFYGALGAFALVVIGRRWLSGAAGWLAAAVLFSAHSIAILTGQPYVDLTLLLYATLAFWALGHFLWSGPQAQRWLLLSGVLAGLALSTKYTALALPPALALALLVSRIRDWRSAIRNAFLLGIVALLVWSPWLLKNLVLTGNPTYPFFFGGIYWNSYRAEWYDRPGTGLLYTETWRLLVAPWDATIWSVEGAALEGFPSYGATIGPLFLSLLPFLLLVWQRLPLAQRRWLRAVLVFCGVLYGFWLWGVARSALLIQTRLLFPAFGLLALIVGVAVEGLGKLPQRPVNLSWVVRAVVIGVLVLTLVSTFLFAMQERPLRVLFGFEAEEDFLSRRLGWYRVAVNTINQELPSDAVVLFLWEPRSYHCQTTCLPDALLDRWLHATQHLYGPDAAADPDGAAAAIADAWRTEGVTHVLFCQAGYDAVLAGKFDPITAEDVAVLEALQRDELEEIQNFGDAYVLYRLREP